MGGKDSIRCRRIGITIGIAQVDSDTGRGKHSNAATLELNRRRHSSGPASERVTETKVNAKRTESREDTVHIATRRGFQFEFGPSTGRAVRIDLDFDLGL